MINNSVKKCCVCNNEKIGEFITINDKKYHLCCIEDLQKKVEHYEHLYSEVKKQKDDVVEYIKEHLTDNGRFLMLNEWQVPDLLRMLGEIE